MEMGSEEAQSQDEEAERETWGRRRRDRQTRQCSENILHKVLNLLANATARATATAQKLR